MKIAHVCLSLGKGGAEKLLVDTLPLYVKDGHEVTIIQLSSITEEPTYIDSVVKAGIKIITLSKGGFRNPMLFFKILELVRKNDFDVIHVHLFPCLYYFSLASRFISMPVMVFTEHSTQNRRSTKKILQPIEKFMYARYDAIIAISHNVELMLKSRIPELAPKITMINNGVNVEKFQSAEPYDDLYLKSNFNVDKTTFKILMASRFNYPKDQPTIIRALSHLPDNFHAFFAGDGNNLEDSKKVVVELQLENRVHFLGFRPDISRLMKTADVNVLSSFHEGFSGVTLEGLASGNPFLGTNVPGINDVVPNSDFLFEKENDRELAAKIIEIAANANLRKSMRDTAIVHVGKYDVPFMVQKHLAVYQKLMRSNPQMV